MVSTLTIRHHRRTDAFFFSSSLRLEKECPPPTQPPLLLFFPSPCSLPPSPRFQPASPSAPSFNHVYCAMKELECRGRICSIHACCSSSSAKGRGREDRNRVVVVVQHQVCKQGTAASHFAIQIEVVIVLVPEKGWPRRWRRRG